MARESSVIRALSLLALTFFCTACLGEAYKLDQQELRRLASIPEVERGSEVRGTQLFGRGDHPQPERREPSSGEVAAGTIVVGAANLAAASRARRRRRGNGSRNSARAAGTGLAIVGVAVVLSAVAVVGGVIALGIEEGRRFEGSLELHPTHRLHLRRARTGHLMWRDVRLTELTPELAEWADSAIVDERDGYIERLFRAPLDRRGAFTSIYGAFGGVEGTQWGGGIRLHAGVFPIQHLGLVAIVDFGGGGRQLHTRLGGEVQAFAPALARMHLGAYVESGSLRTRRRDDGLGAQTSAFVGGGAIVQLDVMTRMSFDMRGGMWWAPDGIRPTFSVGFSVY